MAYIRGAVFVENSAESVNCRTIDLVEKIVEANNLKTDEVSAAFFIVTADVTAANPATAVRKTFGFVNAAYMCAVEPSFVGSAKLCVRVCLIADKLSQQNAVHVYEGEAATLRPDISHA